VEKREDIDLAVESLSRKITENGVCRCRWSVYEAYNHYRIAPPTNFERLGNRRSSNADAVSQNVRIVSKSYFERYVLETYSWKQL
jgi:hypothetical protein